MAAGRKLYVAHNVDVQRKDDSDGAQKGAMKTVRYKAGQIVAGNEFTKEELDSLKESGSVRPATPDEEDQVDAQEAAAKTQALQAENDVERQQLAREHASQRSQIEKKHEAAKQAELQKLEEKHAGEREALDKKLSKGIAAANKGAEK